MANSFQENLWHSSGRLRGPEDFIIPALDVSTVTEAKRLVDILSPVCTRFKVGKHFLLDPQWSQFIHQEFGGETTKALFLDFKDFDTSESSRLFAQQIYNYNIAIDFFTVHAIRQTIEAAISQRKIGTSILAVPLLTSFGPAELKEAYNWDVDGDGPVLDFFLDRAEMALDCGVDGLICSAQEVLPLRKMFGLNFGIVVPGFHQDHQRSGTPGQAIKDGADFVVIGRRIITADDPLTAFNEVVEEISKVL